MKTPGTGYYGQGGGQGGGTGRRPTNASEANSPDSRIYIPSITSQEILDENAQSRVGKSGFANNYPHEQRQGRGMNRKVLVIAVVVVVAIVGAVVAYVATKGSDSNSASNESGGAGSTNNSTGSTTDSSKSTTSKPSTTTDSSSDSSTTKKDGNAKVRTDPTTETYPLTAFAIGDWGQTIAQNDSCCQRRKGKFNGYDWNAEAGVAKLMDLESTTNKPAVVLSHGDNFYWTGIDGKKDQEYRFEQTFESRHKVEAMGEVPWINVMGNHDYGGGSYICRDADEQLAKCDSTAALLQGLEDRFTLQSTYKSPNSNRWVLTDHFYKYSLTKGDVSMDIFNLDMNDAESHGANEICCQCYSYSKGNNTACKTVTRGDKNCCAGDSGMYDGCVGKFKEWGQEAMTKLVEGVKASKATWKIVNSHYSPYGHYGEGTGSKWLETLDGLGVQLWIAGHTHGTKHDFGSFATHFVENGAGGGIQSESASGIPPYATALKNVWTAPGYSDGGNEYGFFTLQASENWLKLRFLTFDDSWALATTGSSLGSSKIGGVKEGYCYYIPSDGDEGKVC